MQHMGAGGDLKAWREFPRYGGAADVVGGFQHQHLPAAAGQIRGADKAVMAGADNNAVVVRRHARTPRPISRKISRAALAPGAPITPPPGCVLDPHI